ncbi:MAG TPA: pyridoxal-dependent decarboxylase, exosortase A system-associated, partial [Allosphingosinicella sp.]
MGAIPDGFGAEDGMLLIGGRRADSLVTEAGDTPLFAYDVAKVASQVELFRRHFPGVNLHYAIKANTYAPLLRRLARLVDGLDVASAGEMHAALEAGTNSSEISFAGPGKRDDELASAIAAGVTLNLESEG